MIVLVNIVDGLGLKPVEKGGSLNARWTRCDKHANGEREKTIGQCRAWKREDDVAVACLFCLLRLKTLEQNTDVTIAIFFFCFFYTYIYTGRCLFSARRRSFPLK